MVENEGLRPANALMMAWLELKERLAPGTTASPEQIASVSEQALREVATRYPDVDVYALVADLARLCWSLLELVGDETGLAPWLVLKDQGRPSPD